MYKSKLQEVCHGKQWGLPRYTAMKHGPDHNPCFRASVSVNGFSFDSPVACKSSKQAQNEAAMLAFLHFTSPPSPSYPSSDTEPSTSSTIEPNFKGPETEERNKFLIQSGDARVTDADPEPYNTLKEAERAAANAVSTPLSQDSSQINDESGRYKNLLQELAQKEGFCMPAYKTVKSGASHMPTFSSTVEVEGEQFCGKVGKSKKEAELSAAKVAYIALKQRGLSRSTELSSPHVIKSALKATQISDLTVPVDSLQNRIHEHQSVPSAIKYEERANKIKGIDIEVQESGTTEVQMDHMYKTSSCSELILPPTDESRSSQTFKKPKWMEMDVSVSDTNGWKGRGLRSYLLCNRVKVYNQFPDVALPNYITVLPVSDDRWVPFILEFPNEESN